MGIEVWKVYKWADKPEKIIYERETGKFYVREDGRRDAKQTSWYETFASEQDAIDKVAELKKSEGELKRLELTRKAAPDLLDALEELFSSYKQLADSGDAGNWSVEELPEGIKALAAIASAKGESN